MSKPITDYVPFYRDSTRAWGAIKRLMIIPCAVPAEVYFEASVSALWRIAYNIASPDPKEIYHQLIGNSLYHDIKQGAQDTHIVSPVDQSRITRGLFLLADFVDVAAWYMFLFGSVVDGLVDFSSQVIKAGKCATPHSPHFFQGTGYINAIGDDGNFYGDLFSGTKGNGVPTVGGASFSAHNGQGGFCAGSCGFATFGGAQSVGSDTAVIETGSDTIVDIGEGGPDPDGNIRLGHAFFKMQNQKNATFHYTVKSRYTDGEPLPLHEAFRDGDRWYGSSFDLNS